MIAIVSNMLILRRAYFERCPLRTSKLCNMGATLFRRIAVGAAATVCACGIGVVTACADQQAPEPEHKGLDAAKFLAGAAAGFVAHEAGHLLFDVVFDA